MQEVLLVVHLLVALGLIGVVLLQRTGGSTIDNVTPPASCNGAPATAPAHGTDSGVLPNLAPAAP